MKNKAFLILFLLIASFSTYGQSPVGGGANIQIIKAVPVPEVKAYTIWYSTYSEFLTDITAMTSQYGAPYQETTPNVPANQGEIVTHLSYADTPDIFPAITNDCSDFQKFYVVIWKREGSNKAFANVDVMFSLKGFDGEGIDFGKGCYGKAGNWFQAFKIPSNTNLPQFLLDKL